MGVLCSGRLLRRWPKRALLAESSWFHVTSLKHDKHVMVQTSLPVQRNKEFVLSSRQLGLGHNDSLLPFGARQILWGRVDQSLYCPTSSHNCERKEGVSCKSITDAKVRSFFSSARVNEDTKPPEKGIGAPPIHEAERKSAVLQSVLDLSVVPVVPLALGLAGAIPFIALASPIAPLLPLPELLARSVLHSQAAYGACILTFLGAPHWGLAMANDSASASGRKIASFTVSSLRYVWSVVPSLVAWLALLLDPVPQFTVLAASFAVVLGVDIGFARLGLVPAWYLPLRIPLSLIAIISLATSIPVAMAIDTFSRLKAKPHEKQHSAH